MVNNQRHTENIPGGREPKGCATAMDRKRGDRAMQTGGDSRLASTDWAAVDETWNQIA
jgi:hypothetical protein